MPYKVGFAQHHGKDMRFPKQQDSLWNGTAIFQERDLPSAKYRSDQDGLTVAVADGVGNSPQAERASRVVLDALASELAAGASFDVRLIRRVHGHLCDGLARGRTFGSATTLAAAQFRGDCCTVLNVGDSRVYRIAADGTWQQLSHDHTLINAMIARGEADPGKEYASFYYSLDSCLVADDEEFEFPVHYCAVPFLPGDALLLCTDGVHDTLGDTKLQDLADSRLSPQEQVEVWRNAVLAAGAPDNLSLVFVRKIA